MKMECKKRVSWQEPAGVLPPSDHRLLSLLLLVTKLGRNVMHQVFLWGCPHFGPNKSVKDYLLQDCGITPQDYNSIFNKNMQVTLHSGVGHQFDILLLWLVIKVGCQDVAERESPLWFTADPNQLEFLLTQLKEERYSLLHTLPQMDAQQLEFKMEEMRQLLIRIVQQACHRFKVDSIIRDQFLQSVEQHYDQLRSSPLTKADILQCHTELFKTRAVEELKLKYKSLATSSVLSFIMGADIKLQLEDIFSELEIVRVGTVSCDTSIDLMSILELVDLVVKDQDGSKSCVVMVDGMAGSGKTTLTKLYMMAWAKCDLSVPNLNDYDLLLYIECRYCHIDSFKQLLEYQVPGACSLVGDDLVNCVQSLRLLVVLDGINELNENSEKLVHEIFSLCQETCHTIVCTSRPKGMHTLSMIVPSSYNMIQLQITGIPIDEVEEFVCRYHDKLVALKMSCQSTDELKAFVRRTACLCGFLRYAQNLVLVTCLWAFSPDQVKQVTTVAELYYEVCEMLQMRVLERLKAHNLTKTVQELKRNLNTCVSHLYQEAFLSITHNQVLLQPKSQVRLQESCMSHGLSFDEVASSFLVQQSVDMNYGLKKQLYFPHQDIHDYFAAQGLFLIITDPVKEMTGSSQVKLSHEGIKKKMKEKQEGKGVLKSLFEDLQKKNPNGSNRNKFQNILKHFGGILTLHDSRVERGTKTEKMIEELVALIQEGGVTHIDQWLAFLAEIRCDKLAARIIAANFYTHVENIMISSAHVASYVFLMPHCSPKHITLDLLCDPDHIPLLPELLRIISLKDCSVALQLQHFYFYPYSGISKTCDNVVLHLLPPNAKCRLERLYGIVSGENLPVRVVHNLDVLYIVLMTNQQASRTTASLLQQPVLSKFVRVLEGVDPSCLTRLPANPNEQHALQLCGLNDHLLDWGCRVASSLQGHSFSHIALHNSSLSYEGMERFLRGLQQAGVRIESCGLIVPFNCMHISPEKIIHLQNLARQMLQSHFFIGTNFSSGTAMEQQ